jgi:plasmid stability protein
MKTAVDLPDALAREVKIRAAERGQKLKDVIAELLRLGLDASVEATPEISVNALTGLPMIVSKHPARRSERLTSNRVAEILLDQEVDWNREASR